MNVINFFNGTAILGFASRVPLYAEERFGLRALSAGTLLTARAIGMMAVAALATFALRRTGYRLPMIVGFAISWSRARPRPSAGCAGCSGRPAGSPGYR